MKNGLNNSVLIGLLCLLGTGGTLFAQSPTPFLEKVITINVHEQRMGAVLQQIEEKAGFTFSYSNEIINSEEAVSIDATQKSVREILQQLFKARILYKEKGPHIILTKAPVEKSAVPSSVKISGYVVDVYSGDKIAYASIYNSKTLHSVNSDEYGFYSFKIDKASLPLNLSYNKINYRDTLVSIVKHEASNVLLNVPLTPVPVVIKPDTEIVFAPARDTVLSFLLIASLDSLKPAVNPAELSKRELIEQNVVDTLYRVFQVSFLPFAGSNHKMSGRVVNDFSFNILGGYNMGVSRFELGGLFNINRAYVKKAQIGGLFNYVHGNMTGVQVGGLFNIVLRQSSGVQIAGLGNIRIDTASGLQVGGLFNIAGKGIKGSQIGGLFNISGGETGGAQVGGLFNIAAGEIGGAQVGGLFNYAHRSVNGAQVGGLFNIAGRDVRGLQLSGLINRARVVKGAQVTGIINIARTVHAAQVGFLNFADTVHGVPIGFLSFVRSGYISFEASADESFYANLTFRTGVRKFYNILTGGVRFENSEKPLYAAGYGIGVSPKVGKRWYLNFELTSQQLLSTVDPWRVNLHNRFLVGTDFIAAKRFALSVGFSINGHVAATDYPEFTTTFSPGDPFFIKEYNYSNGYRLNLWWGARVGLKVLLGKGV